MKGDWHMQAHARGGEWPRLYSAIAHVDLDLGLIGRALYWVHLRPLLQDECKHLSELF